jgi:hypothetical protein
LLQFSGLFLRLGSGVHSGSPLEDAVSDLCQLDQIARSERSAATDIVSQLLPPEARVSVYLFQPIIAAGLRPESPGALWDIGPLPPAVAATDRDMLYQCAEAGRTGSFLQSATECTRRVPQTSCIDRAASRSYRHCTAEVDVRRAQIAVEQQRYGFRTKSPDGPPEGYFIHHLALAPSVQSFWSLSSGRLPVLGTIFTVTADEAPIALHEYSNLVDYAIFIAGELLEIRAEHLLGRGHVGVDFEGSALEDLLDRPTSDAAVQLVTKLLFAHHWFFPYDPAAFALLQQLTGAVASAVALYRRHGWSAPRTAGLPEVPLIALRARVTADLATLLGHICWYRLGKDFRPRPGAVVEGVRTALNTALLLLCGVPSELSGYARRPGTRRSDRSIYLGPPARLALDHPGERLLAPVFAANSVAQLVRQQGDEAIASRFAASFAVCGPGDSAGHTRTHLKPSRYIEGFGHGQVPRFSPRMQESTRDRTRWVCAYSIGRLAEAAVLDRMAAL